MPGFNLAVVQFNRKDDEAEANLQRMKDYLRMLPAGIDLVLLPENWLGSQIIEGHGYREMMEELALVLDERCLLTSGAQYVRPADGKPLSRGLFLGGGLPGPVVFEKRFPSRSVGERGCIYSGTALPLVEHRGIQIGAVICVDLFYPELVRDLALRGALLILNPANIPRSRLSLWQHIGITRACENTVFVVMANNTGTVYPDGRAVQGGSFVARPDGYGLQLCGQDAGVYYFTLDLDLIYQVRQRWPYLEDARITRFKDGEVGPKQ